MDYLFFFFAGFDDVLVILQLSHVPDRPTRPTITNTIGQNFHITIGRIPMLIIITSVPIKISVSGQKSL